MARVVLHLSDARQRAERAREQIARLDQLLNPALQTERNSVLVDYDPNLGCHTVSVSIRQLPPDESRFVVGEALHSLRFALDYIAWQLALLHLKREPTEQEAREVFFPILDRPEWFAKSKALRYVSDDAGNEFALHQTYSPKLDTAHHPAMLSILRDLTNMDKHKLLMLSGQNFRGLGSLPYRFSEPIDGIRVEAFPEQEGKLGRDVPLAIPIFRLWLEPMDRAAEIEVHVDPQPPVAPAFGGTGDYVDSDRLKALVECIEFIIGRFDTRFFPPMPAT